MAKKQSVDKDRATQIILETVKKEKPETTEQLVRLVQEQTALPDKELTRLLLKLENDDLLHFTKKEAPVPSTFQTYLSSKRAAWFWVTVGVALATTVAFFVIPETVYPVAYLRYALSIVSVVFLPGYAIVKVLYPVEVPIKIESQSTDTLERVALSLGVSVAVVPIISLLLNYTPWGISLVTLALSLLALTTVFALAAVFREYQSKVNLKNSEQNPPKL
jgi:hypothetical protein